MFFIILPSFIKKCDIVHCIKIMLHYNPKVIWDEQNNLSMTKIGMYANKQYKTSDIYFFWEIFDHRRMGKKILIHPLDDAALKLNNMRDIYCTIRMILGNTIINHSPLYYKLHKSLEIFKVSLKMGEKLSTGRKVSSPNIDIFISLVGA